MCFGKVIILKSCPELNSAEFQKQKCLYQTKLLTNIYKLSFWAVNLNKILPRIVNYAKKKIHKF